MTNAMPWKAAINKELRALFPAWTAFAIASIVSIAFAGNWIWAIFILSAVALGALSIGHEYLHGTLSLWLALPVSRWQLAAAKLAALVPLLASLAILTTLGLIAANGYPGTRFLRLELYSIGLPLIYGLIVAPWLTMVARGPLGGVVFTLAVPVVVGLAVALFDPLERVRPSFEIAMTAFAVVGAVAGWWTFIRLEALDTHRDVELPKLFGARRTLPASGAPRPIWALFTKELRLQQMTVLVAALSFTAVLVGRWYHSLAPDTNLDLTYALGVVHLALVPILAGALASAEERRLGTLEWQVLQPTATWKQWLVKVTVVVALSIVVSLAPLVLLYLLYGADRHAHVIWVLTSGLPLSQAIVIVAGLAIATLYVSSLSTSGIRAIMTSIPVLAVVGALAPLLARLMSNRTLYDQIASARLGGFRSGPVQASMEWLVARWAPAGFSQRTMSLILNVRSELALAFVVGLAVLVLRFALVNHRSAERGGRRVVRQAVMFFGCVLVIQFIFTSLSALQVAGFYRITQEQRKVSSESMVRRARWEDELGVLTRGFDGRVGVCAGDGRLEACLRDNQLFPMQSVMKLPVAVSALEAVDDGTWRLDDEVVVHKQDLSVFVQPIAKLIGPNGFKTTIGDLVRRAIVDSDSAATDILIAKLGGPGAVQLTLNRKATGAVRVDRDEKHLQTEISGLEWRDEYLDPATLDRAINAAPEAQRDEAFQAYLRDRRDTSTPRGMTILLDKLAAGRLLSSSSTQFLLDTLKQTTTFPDRLKAGVPDGWTIGHKTGTSGSWRGVTAAFNDVGILTGPKGERISIAVFITESKASDKDMAKLMADIARAIATKY